MTTRLDELMGVLEGEVRTDEMTRALYSSGACLYRVLPEGVVWPKNREDVLRTVRFAAERRIPITPRGGGTSRTGNELGPGIVLDFSKHMGRVVEFLPQERRVRVQPGLILSELNRFLKPHGLFFPPDPSTSEHCTLGGMIANNSSGPRSVKYGTTRRYVRSVELVLSTGEVMTTGPVEPAKAAGAAGAGTAQGKIYAALPEILHRFEDALAAEKPFATKDSSGYHLWDLRQGDLVDITPLIAGSEGTLGIVTEALLEVAPLASKRLSALVYFDDLSRVGEATQRILAFHPSMLEIMERQILDLARKQKPEMRPYLPEGIEAILFVEMEGEDEETLRDAFDGVRSAIVEQEPLARDLAIARSAADMDLFTKVRSISGPILNKVQGSRKPRAFIEDPAVHPSRLPQYIEGLRSLFRKYEVEASIYGHAGDGNLHSMVFVDLRRPEEVAKMVSLSSDVYDLVLELKGTISGEHGDGRLRSHFLRRQYPGLYRAFEEIKQLFDPADLLNPGVIVGADDNPLAQNLKFLPREAALPAESSFRRLPLQAQIDTCSGCGKCRSYCPVARQVGEEWAMGRGKIALVREVLSGQLSPTILDSPAFKKILDSCMNCKRCLSECPSGVDVPWFALCGRADFVRKRGEPLGQRLLADTGLLCRVGSSLAPLVNLANEVAPARALLEKTVGLDRRRRLPPFAGRTLRSRLRDRPRHAGDKKVALFVSCYSNFNDPEGDGLAALEVLEHNGVEVLLPDFRCCGIARINAGAGDRVMEDIRFNVRELGKLAARGLDVLFSEPSCALAVKMEYSKILGEEEMEKIAERCFDIHAYLWKLHQEGALRQDFGRMDLKVGHHNPCHLRALGDGKTVSRLLGLIPGMQVLQYGDDCCGLGGTFGMKKENFDLSMGMGQRLFREIQDSQVGAVVTSCGACKMQILQGTGREAVHPLSILAKAYRAAAPNGPASTRGQAPGQG